MKFNNQDIGGKTNKSLNWLTATFIIASFLLLTTNVKASEEILAKAQVALSNDQYKIANNLFLELSSTKEYQVQGLFGLAKIALSTKNLDDAEDYIEEVLKLASNKPEYLFIAGRIAGAQAQEANIFSKLGYARDAKKYFEQALLIDPKHQASIIGLIRFHQQAPVMAGGDKESIPGLINQLREVDKKAAFSMESPKLIEKGNLEILEKRYQAALNDQDAGNSEQFKYDYAMLLSNYGQYPKALDAILTVDLSNQEAIADFSSMRFYQVAKLSAESRREFDLGIQSIHLYAQLPASEKSISEDWVEFRLKQLQFLNGDEQLSINTFKKLKNNTKEKSLKTKIGSFIKEVKEQTL